MKKLLPLLTLCMSLCCVSCYDDSPILERLETLEKTTISALQASISALEAKDADILKSIAALEGSDSATQEEIQTLKTLSSEIEKTIVELREWIEKILEGYYTSEEIDEQLASINKEIQSLTEKVSSLESKLNNLTAEFSIVFDDSEVGILAGGTTSVGYTITGATDKTTVKALGQNGWSAKVTPEGTDKGKITVTAPNPLTEDEIIVLVYDGEYRTIMSSINFVTGVVTPSQTAVELEAGAGTVDISVTSNLDYTVSIPEDAKGWLSVVETKATKTETITFAYTECVGGIRKATVSFVDDGQNTISSMTFIQQGSAVEVTITEAGTLIQTIGEDVYRDIKGLIVNGPLNGTDIIYLNRMNQLSYLNLYNARIVEGGNAYYNNLHTQNDVIGERMFIDFGNENSPCHIILPSSITTIGEWAFEGAQITLVDLPDSLKEIGWMAFGYCSQLKTITLPKSLETIGQEAFEGCRMITTLTIPENLKSLGLAAFNYCDNLTEIHIKASPTTLTYIGSQIFDGTYDSGDNYIYNTATLYLPKGTKEAYSLTDFGRFVNIIEE